MAKSKNKKYQKAILILLKLLDKADMERCGRCNITKQEMFTP